MPIRIVLAEDHPITRKGISDTLNEDPTCDVVAETGNGAMIEALVREHQPDVLVTDLEMPGLDGLHVLESIRSSGLAVEVVILTMHDSEPFFRKALSLGARGYVLKDSAIGEILDAVKFAYEGRVYVSAPLTSYLMGPKEVKAPESDLTPSELRILKAIAEGKTTRAIAGELFLSDRTIETHRRNICEKLNLSGKNALLHYVLVHRDRIAKITR
jgi:DNA-binding NarL/FixJ family response regulator